MRLICGWLGVMLLGVNLGRGAEPVGTAEGPGLYAHFQTARGELVARLFFQEAPLTVTSFVGLAEGTLPEAGSPKYFERLTFHRVVPGFVVQGGDPLGTGEGGPGYSFPDEFVPGLRHGAEGMLSMANSGPDTNGSQFFFTLAPVNRLNYLHSVFGEVVSGGDVLRSIQKGDTFSVSIVRRGAEAEGFVASRARFDLLLSQARRAQPPHFADPEGLLPSDPPREKAFNAKLQNFERFTGATVYARLYPVRDPIERAFSPDEIAARRAAELRLGEGEWAVVYFADVAAWGFWWGGLEPRWTGAEGGDGREGLARFLAHARQSAQAAVAKLEAEGRTLTPADRLKMEVDEVLDGLLTEREALLPQPVRMR